MLVATLAILLTLILVVGIHELGHAVAAHLFGVKIKQITIGFGRPLFKWPGKKGYDWVWALWPLGGSVSLVNSRISPVDPSEYPYAFDKQSIWVRVCILLSGAAANILTAWLAFIIAFLVGIHYKVPLIQTVAQGSVAYKAGAVAGDRFIAVAGQSTPSWREVGMELIDHWGAADLSITVLPVGSAQPKVLHFNVSALRLQRGTTLLSSMGITPNVHGQKALLRASSLLDAIHQASTSVVNVIYFFLMILKHLFTGVIPFSVLLGPLGLFAATISSITQGLAVFMYFIATLSLAVAFVNLLPIPVLDGGSILYCLIEKIRGKPVSIAMEVLIHRLFIIVFCIALAHLLSNDLQRFHS